MMSTEETTGKTIKYWDIASPTNPAIRSEVLDPDGQMAHNAHVKGSFAYVSHYSAGIRIYDLSDPDNVTEAAYYDTYPGASGLFAGCWGAFPFFASGKVLASDRVTGLYVLFFAGAAEADPLDPNPPQDASAYSDYTMLTSMSLTWADPSTLFGGAPLSPGEFTIEIERDGAAIGSVPGGVQQFTDNGLVDGQEYEYALYAKLVASDSASRSATVSWIAGGSPIPTPPTNVGLTGDASQVTLFWRNPSVNVDGTPMDDFAGLNLYQDGTMVATFTKMSADTSQLDSASYSPLVPGNYAWHLTVIDNETPQNESEPSAVVFTPINVPVNDDFPTSGPPNPDFWINDDADVNARTLSAPSPPFALNLNGHPDGGDVVDLRSVDLTGFQGSGITFSYAYQPQGTGNSPEPSDSLLVYFKNDLGSWVQVRGYPGRLVQSFQSEAIALASAPNGGGTYFFTQFQVRFKSLGTPSTSSFFDDWFIDDVSLSVPTSVGGTIELPKEFAVSSNYPNPFNPTTTINYELPTASVVRLGIYDVLGQKVRTLVDEAIDAGSHKAIWDGRNDAGVQVVSGTYIYRFEAGGFVKTRKMVLVK
jgi:hypothetical protein